MSEKFTPEQIQAITKAVESHLQNTGQTQVSAQQLLPTLLLILNQLPSTITNLIVTPLGGITTVLISLLNALINVLTGTVGLVAGTNLAPQLVNIIKQHVPTQAQNPSQQQPPQL
jgi:hypothetical protein